MQPLRITASADFKGPRRGTPNRRTAMIFGLNQPAIRFTIFENMDGRLSKKIELNDCQRFVKTGSTQLNRGRFQTVSLPFRGDVTRALRSFALAIEHLESNK